MSQSLMLAPGGRRFELAGREIHCGDVLELEIDGAWVPARIEWSDRLEWYAVLPGEKYRRVLAGDRARWPR